MSQEAATATGGTVVLNFVIQNVANPSMTYWYVEAVAASVAAYFNYSTKWIQCVIANSVNGQTSCCSASPASGCNTYALLATCLDAIGSNNGAYAAATFAQVMSQIDAGAPIGVVLANNGATQMLAIYGYQQPNPLAGILFLANPTSGYSLVNFAEFPSGYWPGSTWNNSYWTKKANG